MWLKLVLSLILLILVLGCEKTSNEDRMPDLFQPVTQVRPGDFLWHKVTEKKGIFIKTEPTNTGPPIMWLIYIIKNDEEKWEPRCMWSQVKIK